MKISDVYDSNFIRADREGHIDIDGKPWDKIVTIASAEVTEFKPDKPGDKPKRQIVLGFSEIEKMKLGLNITNCRSIMGIIGSEDTDDWIGKKIELITVPEDQSKTGHAVRIRKPRTAATPAPVVSRFGPAAAANLGARLATEKRSIDNLRTHLMRVFPQYESAFTGDPSTWPSECGTKVAEWFATLEPSPIGGGSMGEEDIPFNHGAFDW